MHAGSRNYTISANTIPCNFLGMNLQLESFYNMDLSLKNE